MPLSSGCNHVTTITGDIDRLIGFYRRVFDAEVIFEQDEGDLRHAGLDLGGGFFLHPFQFRERNPNATPSDAMFHRGHIDHFALNFTRPEDFAEARRRLVAEGATAGNMRDFGMFRIVSFRDPDGMSAEIGLHADGPALTLEESSVEIFAEA